MVLDTEQQILKLIQKSERILLLPSAPPDGDSLGSALALYLVLKKLGKEATVICAEPIPEVFKFLPTTQIINQKWSAAQDFIVTLECKEAEVSKVRYEVEPNKFNIIVTPKRGDFKNSDVTFSHGPARYDLVITLDTADLKQLGIIYEENSRLFYELPVINIDHHASNAEFGKINQVDIMASSTTEILVFLIEDLERETSQKLMDEDIATLLLAGIITDTGSFQHSNTTPKAFAVAAHLLDLGARQQEIIQHVYKTKNLSTLKLWGRVLSKIRYDEKLRFVWSTITQEDLKETGADEEESAGIIDELLTNAPGAEVVLLLKEKQPEFVSGSLRTTKKGINASNIAEMFGGGGHPQAAGFRIKNREFGEVQKEVIGKIRGYQAKRLGEEIAVSEENLEPVSPSKPKAEDLLLKEFKKRKEREAKLEEEKEEKKIIRVEDILEETEEGLEKKEKYYQFGE